MNRKTRADERIEALDVSPNALTQQIDDLRQRLERAEQEAAESRAGWQRSAADFANFRRRTEQERDATLGLANELLLSKVLSVVDDFDRALAAMPRELEHLGWIEGIWLVERKLRALLESEGVTPIEAVGKPFDPREHEAVVHQPTADAADGTVLGELQRGYRIRDRILRPALVTVAKNTGAGSAGPETSSGDGGASRGGTPAGADGHHDTSNTQATGTTAARPHPEGSTDHGQDHRYRSGHDELRRGRHGGR